MLAINYQGLPAKTTCFTQDPATPRLAKTVSQEGIALIQAPIKVLDSWLLAGDWL